MKKFSEYIKDKDEKIKQTHQKPNPDEDDEKAIQSNFPQNGIIPVDVSNKNDSNIS